jgi:hypothetical protein
MMKCWLPEQRRFGCLPILNDPSSDRWLQLIAATFENVCGDSSTEGRLLAGLMRARSSDFAHIDAPRPSNGHREKSVDDPDATFRS